MTTGKTMKKPRSLNALYVDARIVEIAPDEYVSHVEYVIDMQQPELMTPKQSERLALWLLRASKWIKAQPKKKVRR